MKKACYKFKPIKPVKKKYFFLPPVNYVSTNPYGDKFFLSKIGLFIIILSNSFSHCANSWTILIGISIIFSFIAKVESRKISVFLSLYLISGKSKSHLWFIQMLRSFFYFLIVVAKYYSSVLDILYYIVANG